MGNFFDIDYLPFYLFKKKMISKIEYKKYLEKFHLIFDEERICKIFLITNMFADAIGDEDELLYYSSAYLYLYIKSMDDAVDQKDHKALRKLLETFDYQNKSWELFIKYCDQSKFELYWNKYLSLTKEALQNRLDKKSVDISELWKMSSFMCLTPAALCIKHNKIDDIELWEKFVTNLFCAIQIVDDVLDLLEDCKNNVFNVFESFLNKYQGRIEYIPMFHSVESKLIEKASLYIDDALINAESLSGTKWIAYCNNLKNQLASVKNLSHIS